MVEFAHSEATFAPHPRVHPEWNGYDQIDESGFHDAARRAPQNPDHGPGVSPARGRPGPWSAPTRRTGRNQSSQKFGQRIDVSHHVPAPTSVPARELHRP